jgi:hypothetical protein
MSSRSSIRLIGAAVATACAALGAPAEEFSWQLSGITGRAEVGDFSRDSWAVDATYYFKPVDDSSGPYALASFLHPTTRVSAAASKVDADLVSDPAAYTLSGAFVLPGEKWYVTADYSKSKVDDTPLATYSDPKGYGVSAGRYLGANTTLELGWGGSEQKSSLGCPPGLFCTTFVPFEVETTTDSVGLEVFHVRRFRSLVYSLEGRVSQSDADVEFRSPFPLPANQTGIGDKLRVYSVATELFPTNRLGVRVGYSRPDGNRDVDSYDVAATWFFKPRIAVQFGLSRSNIEVVPTTLRPTHSESAAVRFIGRL